MSTGGYALPSARTVLSNVVAVGGPVLVGSLAYVADVVAPEYAAAGGAIGVALGTLWVNCPRRPKVYAIRGKVTASPNALNNLTVQYSGTSCGTVPVGLDGKYEIPGLAPDSDYTVKVADVPYHTLTPAEYKVVKVGADKNNADFTVAHNKLTLNGRIKPAGQETVSNIKVQYGEKSVNTLQDGSFTIPDLLENERYVIKPVCPANHVLNTSQVDIDHLAPGNRAEFTLTREYFISGKVTVNPKTAQDLTVQYAGTSNGSVPVNPDGTYEITGLALNGTYNITIEDVPFHTAAPPNYKVAKVKADKTNADFTLSHNRITLNGKIEPSGQEKVDKIEVKHDGGSVLTKVNGLFTIPDLLENEPYVIKPVCPDYHTLNLTEIRIDHLSAADRADFVLTRTRYTISGRVTANPQNLAADVEIFYDPDSAVAPVKTGQDGRYSIPDLLAGEKYTVKPLRMHYPAQPLERTVPSLTQNTALNFTIKLAHYTIAGVVNEVNEKGEVQHPMDGVTVTLAGGAQPDDTTTGPSGKFTFTVPALANYTLSYAKSKVEFEPESPSSFSPLLCDKALDITGFDTSWLKAGKKVKPPRQPRWYDNLPRRSGGVGDWNAYESIASGYGAHSADHLPELIAAVGQGPFGRADVLPRIVAYAIQNGIRSSPTLVSCRYTITTLPNAFGPPIVLGSSIVVIHNFIANPLNTSCGTVYAR